MRAAEVGEAFAHHNGAREGARDGTEGGQRGSDAGPEAIPVRGGQDQGGRASEEFGEEGTAGSNW